MKYSNKKIIEEKLNYFLKNKKKVHIIKTNTKFLNGYLIEKLPNNIYILEDEEGRRIEVFISEIFDVNNFSFRRESYD